MCIHMRTRDKGSYFDGHFYIVVEQLFYYGAVLTKKEDEGKPPSTNLLKISGSRIEKIASCNVSQNTHLLARFHYTRVFWTPPSHRPPYNII